jgi:class 3 adenylate cyclase
VLKSWGTYAQVQSDIGDFLPSFADDRSVVDWWHRYTLLSQAPGASVAAARKYMYADVRPILASIHVPTLVLYRPDVTVDLAFEPSARFLAERIPGAQLQELPGSDSALWVGGPEPVRAIDAFLGDVRRETSELERVLATVLFTDIVDSTATAAELGNSAWGAVVERHHSSVRALLERFRGREVDTAGDGFFATFDGPARAIRCAKAIVDDVSRLGIEVRAGVHTGECEMIDGKVAGVAVNIGARIGALAPASGVLVSRTVKDLVVGSGLVLESAGLHELKGVPGEWELYRVE